MSRVAQAAFALLVVATFGAFFVAQRLKNSDPLIQQLGVTPVFSPNQDGRKERGIVSFKLKNDDDVTLEVVDAQGDVVATLLDGRFTRAGALTSVRWDGTDDDGEPVPDGLYRPKLTLRREGRAVVLPRSMRKDSAPPRPAVTSIGPVRDAVPRPELLPKPDGRPATVRFTAPGGASRLVLFRTSPGPVDRVFATAQGLEDGVWEWDGTLDGRRARAGTYLVVVESRDVAGNIGTSVPLDRQGLPRLPFGERLPGRGGITVRYLGVQPPLIPVQAGGRVEVAIDARTEAWTASLRRVGAATPSRRFRGTRPILRFTAPDGVSGVHLLTVRTATHRQRVPILVQSRERKRVLVVVPALTWQGRNPVDDDGDGRINVLDQGLPARLGRPFTRDGLPDGFARREALALRWLDAERHRFDLSSDVGLTLAPPKAADYRGVLLVGETRWLTPEAGRWLRAFARGGGTVVSLGTQSLRRQVTLTPRGRMVDPTAEADLDLFGARITKLEQGPVALTATDDALALFEQTNGALGTWGAFEATRDDPDAAYRIVSTGVTPGGRPVVVGARLGDGTVVRMGLPDFATRLADDPQVQGLMEGAWTLLAR